MNESRQDVNEPKPDVNKPSPNVLDDFDPFEGDDPNTETPSAVAPSPMLWRDVAKQAARNLPGSLWRNIVDTVSIVRPENAKALLQLGEELGMTIYTGAADTFGVTVIAPTPLLDATIDYYIRNYGFGPDGIEGFKRFLAEDPMGFVLDVLTIPSLVGGTAARGTRAASAAVRGTRYAARFERFSKQAERVNDFVNKGFDLDPNASSRFIRGIYKITDTPYLGGALRKAWDVTEDASGARRVGVGATELIDPGALIAGGAMRGVGGVLRGTHRGLRKGLVERAEAEGIDLIASAKTGDKSIGSREGAAVKAGQDEMINLIERMNTQMDDYAERIADGISDVEDPLVAGTRLGSGVEEYTRRFMRETAELYKKWEPEVADKKAVDTALREVLEKIQAEAKNTYGDRPIPLQIRELIEALESPDGKTYLGLKKKRTELREAMGARTDPVVDTNRRWYSMVMHGLTKSMQDTILEQTPHLKPLFDETNEFYARGIEKIKSAWGKKIVKATGGLKEYLQRELGEDFDDAALEGVPDVNPEQIMRMIFSPSTSTTQIPIIYELAGGFNSEAGKAMRGYFVHRLFEKAKKTSTERGDVKWRSNALLAEIKGFDKNSPGALDAFLGKEDADKVRLFAEIAASTESFQRKASGSRTAPLLWASGVGLGTIVDDLGRMVMYGQGFEPLPILVVGGLGTATWISKKEWDRWISTKAGQDWLVYGIDRNAAGKFVSEIAHMKHTALWQKIYRAGNAPLRAMMREEEKKK